MKRVKYAGHNCVIKKGKYSNENLALILMREEDDEEIAVVTINGQDILPPNQSYVKDYSENKGMLEAITNAGLVKKILGYTQMGWVKEIPLVEFNLEDVEELE